MATLSIYKRLACLISLLPCLAIAADRIYYIAADPVVWDYVPTGKNLISGEPFTGHEQSLTKAGKYNFGSQFKKALYREYVDASFSKLKSREEKWKHLGFMGPLIRAEVGDTIRITFRNNVNFPASMHPHGVFYQKDSEGAPYADNTSGMDKADDLVPPGGTHEYTWEVRERTGPVPGTSSTAFWMYHSHSEEYRDFNAGLVGAMIVTASGMARDDLSPTDVDREFVIAFRSTEEAASWYIEENIQTYIEEPGSVNIIRNVFNGFALMTPVGPDFAIRDNMNGFQFGNLPMLTMKKGERVRWYLMGGTNFEIHAPHWHGNTAILDNMRVDTTSLVTMGMQQVNMVPDATGIWLFHCHVSNHFIGGMIARYEVLP
jgi:FtsP/CotA-like multicopper oxidase with cupredoxin domain